jgi:hypothetical protein
MLPIKPIGIVGLLSEHINIYESTTTKFQDPSETDEHESKERTLFFKRELIGTLFFSQSLLR